MSSSEEDSDYDESEEDLDDSDVDSNEDEDEDSDGDEDEDSDGDEDGEDEDSDDEEDSEEDDEGDADEEDLDDLLGLDELQPIFFFTDVHFKSDCYAEGEEFIKKLIKAIREANPRIIICGGDLLHSNETSKQSPFNQVYRLLERCSAIAPTYVIVGNHDLINNKQFCTTNHFFNPYKKWENVFIVDKPMHIELGERNIVLCPYVAPGRLIEALDSLLLPLDSEPEDSDSDEEEGDSEDDDSKEGEDVEEEDEGFNWRDADLIFAHTEIKGVKNRGKENPKADVWDESYPILISGHIHIPCKIGTNVYYPGSSRQVNYDEPPDKKVWAITFDSEEDSDSDPDGTSGFHYEPIDLGLTARKEIEMDCDKLKHFDFSLLDRYIVKIKVKGTSEQFKQFKKSQLYAKMTMKGVRFGFETLVEDGDAAALMLDFSTVEKDNTSFETILKTLVDQKPKHVQKAYALLYGNETKDSDSEESVEDSESDVDEESEEDSESDVDEESGEGNESDVDEESEEGDDPEEDDDSD